MRPTLGSLITGARGRGAELLPDEPALADVVANTPTPRQCRFEKIMENYPFIPVNVSIG
jgi:hypothetical protein